MNASFNNTKELNETEQKTEEENTLLVTHGDFLNSFYNKISEDLFVFSKYCGYSVFSVTETKNETNYHEETTGDISYM